MSLSPPRASARLLEQEGDLGMVALQSRGKQMMMMKPKPLSVRGVFKVLTEIAMATNP